MNKLGKVESAVIVGAVWGSAYLGAFFGNGGDGWRALGTSTLFLLIGFGAVGTINRRLRKKSAAPSS